MPYRDPTPELDLGASGGSPYSMDRASYLQQRIPFFERIGFREEFDESSRELGAINEIRKGQGQTALEALQFGDLSPQFID